ncbi:hypothetical protein MNB_SV-13-146 [hydrothermal vent metagenome]|uniref:Uncharacterized protein n=1 Tax=hydrothermal vent metagenome TaxID=652676 RepID=A0A1W1BZV4_9ZZZZ
MAELFFGLFEMFIRSVFKILQFIFIKVKRKKLIKEWHSSWRDKIEITIGALLLIGFASWGFYFFGLLIYEYYYPPEKTLTEKILDTAFEKLLH